MKNEKPREWHQGYQARLAGQPVSSCPKQHGKFAQSMWVEGWNAATERGSVKRREGRA